MFLILTEVILTFFKTIENIKCKFKFILQKYAI